MVILYLQITTTVYIRECHCSRWTVLFYHANDVFFFIPGVLELSDHVRSLFVKNSALLACCFDHSLVILNNRKHASGC